METTNLKINRLFGVVVLSKWMEGGKDLVQAMPQVENLIEAISVAKVNQAGPVRSSIEFVNGIGMPNGG